MVKQNKGLIVIVSSVAETFGWFAFFCGKCIDACVYDFFFWSGLFCAVVYSGSKHIVVTCMYRLVYQLQNTNYSVCTRLVTPSSS